MAEVFVCIGSNVDRTINVARAIEELEARFGSLRQSAIYESDPVGFEGDPFFNAVVMLKSDKPPGELISIFRSIEAKSGRRRDEPRLGPRTLDLDLLLYDAQVIRCEGVVIPRHEIVEYAFVLRPLAEIAGGRRHPLTGEAYADMWLRFDDSGQITRRVAASIRELSERGGTGRGRRTRLARVARISGADG